MHAAPTTAGLPPSPAPPQDRPASPTPARIAEILAVVSILATYGRHLGQTLEQRAVARGFATIARFFGTVAFETILAHIYRGLMRTLALEHMLRARAARGHDLRVLAPRAPSPRQPPASDQPDPAQTAAPTPSPEPTTEPDAAARAAANDTDAARAAAGKTEAEAHPTRRIAATGPLTLDTLPPMEAIEAEVRRSPVGRTIAAICRDLGIAPALCDGAFWNRLFDAVRLYRGSLGSLVQDMKRREKRFDKEEWKHPGLELPEETRAGIRRVLGFLIGETPVDPFAMVAGPGSPVAAAATGPP